MKENRRINERIWKASPTDVIWWISIHGLAHLGLRGPREDRIDFAARWHGNVLTLRNKFVPVLFVATTIQRCISWPRKKTWGKSRALPQLLPLCPGSGIVALAPPSGYYGRGTGVVVAAGSRGSARAAVTGNDGQSNHAQHALSLSAREHVNDRKINEKTMQWHL